MVPKVAFAAPVFEGMLPFEPDGGEGALQRDEAGCGEHLWRDGADGEGPADEKNAIGEEIRAGEQNDIGQAEQPDAAVEHAHGAVEGGICGKQNAERGVEGEDGEAKGATKISRAKLAKKNGSAAATSQSPAVLTR